MRVVTASSDQDGVDILHVLHRGHRAALFFDDVGDDGLHAKRRIVFIAGFLENRVEDLAEAASFTVVVGVLVIGLEHEHADAIVVDGGFGVRFVG